MSQNDESNKYTLKPKDKRSGIALCFSMEIFQSGTSRNCNDFFKVKTY